MTFLHRTFVAVFAFILLTISSCGSESAQVDNSISKDFDGTEAVNQPTIEQDVNPTYESRKLIWTANLEFQVKKVDASTEKINALSSK